MDSAAAANLFYLWEFAVFRLPWGKPLGQPENHLPPQANHRAAKRFQAAQSIVLPTARHMERQRLVAQ